MTRRLPVTVASLVLLAACASPAASGPRSAATSTGQSAAAGHTAPGSAVASAAAATLTPAPAALAWAPLPASGPAAREDHTWTVDIDGRIAYLFGGREGGTVFGDLWAYDLETDAWAALETHPSPAARFGHEAAWVDGVGLVIFAGQAGSSFFNDLWAYDPDAGRWSELPAAGALPIARYGTCSVVGSDGRLWISHGFTSDGVRFDDTRAYDFPSGIWTDETPTGTRPAERCLHACWLTDDGDLALYAGQTTGVPALGDQWTLAGGGWTQTAGRQPPERNLPAHLRLDSATLVFGGMALDLELLDDLWLLHDDGADAQALAPAGSSPAGRSGATLIRDSRRILLFGGRTADGASSELWVLTGMESQS